MVYEIANLRILIKNKYPFTAKFCERYLSADQASPAHLTATVTEEEFNEEKRQSPNFSDGYIENICLYRSLCLQLPKFNRFLLHSSILQYDGNAYAFLGRSGTGKSTHTRLWLKHVAGCKIVNGDKPIIEYRDGAFIAYGTPWMGKECWGENTAAPLRGICFLRQAKKNEIRKLKPSEASALLFSQILLPSEEESAVATLDLMDKAVCGVASYLLDCDISEEAVKTSFEAMTGRVYEKKDCEEKDEN